MNTLTESEYGMLRVLLKNVYITCANAGDLMWRGEKRGAGNCSCPYARPAGRVIQRLVKAGLAQRHYERNDPRTFYEATRAGERAYMTHLATTMKTRTVGET